MTNQQRIVIFLALIIFAGIALLTTGCAHATKVMQISCFASKDAKKTKAAEEGMGPLIVSNGVVMFYDDDGVLHRITDATCGVKQ